MNRTGTNRTEGERPSGHALRVESLSKRYAEAVALDAVSFSVGPHERVGLVGANGAGKTTLLRILAGTLGHDGGSASLFGKTLGNSASRSLVAYLPEEPRLYPEMTARDYLLFRGELRHLSTNGRREAARSSVERTRATHLWHRTLGTLSKGEQQRVALAASLLGSPPLLLLDEPTSGLDPEQAAETRALLTEIGKECSFLVSSHDLLDVENLCERILVLRGGRLIADGPLAEWKRSDRSRLCLEDPTLDASQLLAGLGCTEPVFDGGLHTLMLPAGLAPADLLAELARRGVRVSEFSPVQNTFETALLSRLRAPDPSSPPLSSGSRNESGTALDEARPATTGSPVERELSTNDVAGGVESETPARRGPSAFAREVFAITRREFRALWGTPLAWILIVIFSLVEGGVFASLIEQARIEPGSIDPVRAFFGQDSLLTTIVLLVLCPALAMRSFAEERRTQNVLHLLASPFETSAITLGKYLAPLATYLVLWATTLSYPLLVASSQSVDFASVGLSYAAIGCIGASFLSFGLLTSALTKNQLTAFVIAALSGLGLYVFSLGEFLLDPGPLRELASYVSFSNFLDEAARGVFDFRRAYLHGSFALGALVLTSLLVDGWREE